MINTKMYDTKNVQDQYKDGTKLNTRISIYDKYKVGGNDMSWMYDAYDFFKGSEIVEFGSGTGKDWCNVMDDASQKYKITLSDFTSGMVEELKKKYSAYKNVDIMQIDIQDIPFDEESKDFALAHAMLYHVPDIDKAVSEVYRILKPGGVFYAATQGSKSVFTFLRDTINEEFPKVSLPSEISFSMQNGRNYLEKYFGNVQTILHSGRLEITDIHDLADFIYTVPSIMGLKQEDRPKLIEYYERMKNAEGKLVIELEYGMFVARKCDECQV